MVRYRLIALLFSLMFTAAYAQEANAILLWPEGAPSAVGQEDQDKPTLSIHLPSKENNTRTAVLVCPGGGYGGLAMDHEGKQIVAWLNKNGMAGFILKYRLGPRYHHPAPHQDATRALQYIRAHAGEFDFDASRLGIIGFSAGGHLVSSIVTHNQPGDASAKDPLLKQSSRPDFAILCYPVITMTESWGHGGSKRNLLGENPDPKLAEFLSSEKQVSTNTPPCFLWHTTEDTAVPVENSLAFYRACVANKVPVEMHIFQYGAHGLGLGPIGSTVTPWPDLLLTWMRKSGFLAAPSAPAK